MARSFLIAGLIAFAGLAEAALQPLPPGKQAARVLVNGQEMPFRIMDIFGSCYVDLTVTPSQNIADFEVLY